jgi:hypothetical protein
LQKKKEIFSTSQLITVLRFQAYVVLSGVYSFKVCYLAFLLNVRHNLPLPLNSLLQGLQKKHVKTYRVVYKYAKYHIFRRVSGHSPLQKEIIFS